MASFNKIEINENSKLGSGIIISNGDFYECENMKHSELVDYLQSIGIGKDIKRSFCYQNDFDWFFLSNGMLVGALEFAISKYHFHKDSKIDNISIGMLETLFKYIEHSNKFYIYGTDLETFYNNLYNIYEEKKLNEK